MRRATSSAIWTEWTRVEQAFYYCETMISWAKLSEMLVYHINWGFLKEFLLFHLRLFENDVIAYEVCAVEEGIYKLDQGKWSAPPVDQLNWEALNPPLAQIDSLDSVTWLSPLAPAASFAESSFSDWSACLI